RPIQLTAILLALVAASGVMYLSRDGEAQPAAKGLPGARPMVEASQYPSLQAALDAVPLDGGVVRLPPGAFEISQPLIVRNHDLLIEGSGTATHIKNVNTTGKSALILKSKEPQAGQKVDPQWRIMLANLRITGNDKSGHGIEAIDVNELYVQGVTVS